MTAFVDGLEVRRTLKISCNKALVVGLHSLSCFAATKQPPNIVLILADDLGYGDLGCYGQTQIDTPRLDELARQGIRFTQHYAGHNVCAPTRCVLMTGKHTGHAFVRGNQQARGAEGQLPLPIDAVTIASVLRSVGFATGMFGKWGLGNPGTTGDPLRHRWDTYFGYTDQIRAHNYFPDFLLKDGRRIPLDNQVKYLSPQAWHKGIGSYSTKQNVYSHDLIERAALDFIRKHRDGPFFAYLPFTLPHDNGEAPRLQMEVPDFGHYAKHKDWTPNSRGYAEMVTRLDRSVGRVIDLLDELGISDDTLVIFTSDNGPVRVREDKPDRAVTAFFRSNGKFRGTKGTFYEGGIRVPMIARWTRRITHGVTSDHPSAHWDFFATACDLIDVPAPPDIDGISYLPTLLGNDADQFEHEYLPIEALAPYAFTVHLKDQALREYEDGFLLGDIPLGHGSFDLKRIVSVIRKAKPLIRFVLEIITRDALEVPCLTESFWATLADVPASDLSRTLRFVRQNPARNLQEVSKLPLEKQVALEDANIAASLRYAREELSG